MIFFVIFQAWRNFFVVDRILTCETLEEIFFVKWDGEEGLDAVSRLCAAVSLLVGEQGIIERVVPTLFGLKTLCRVRMGTTLTAIVS